MRNVVAAFLLMLICASSNAQPGTSKTNAHKIVFQLSSNDTLVWKGLMNNLRHLREGWGDSVIMEVVAHGPGIYMLHKQKSTQQQQIRNFKSMGIQFYACQNTMREKGINPEDLLPDAAPVSMGIGHIVMRQEAGWSYIKSGF